MERRKAFTLIELLVVIAHCLPREQSDALLAEG